MTYNINFSAYSNNFAIPQTIIDDDFESLDAIYLKVILLVLKNSDKHYSVNLLSNLLNASESKIEQAINYWIEKQILQKADNSGIAVPNVVTLSKSLIQVTSKPTNKELGFVLECMENMLARPVTSVEHKTVMHILEFLKLPADVLIMAIEYCVSMDKLNARYLEKLCVSWADNHINTHELAEQYLSLLHQKKADEYKIQKAFGLGDRKLIDSERDYINKWVNEYNYDIDVIKLAYDRTIKAIGKVVFAYINKILLTWNEKNYRTIDDINTNEAPTKVTPSSKKTSYDIDELDKFWDKVPKFERQD